MCRADFLAQCDEPAALRDGVGGKVHHDVSTGAEDVLHELLYERFNLSGIVEVVVERGDVLRIEGCEPSIFAEQYRVVLGSEALGEGRFTSAHFAAEEDQCADGVFHGH